MTNDAKSNNFVDINSKTIYIHDEFDKSVSKEVLPFFDSLIEQEKDKREGKITLDINSIGGETQYLKSMLARVERAKSQGVIVETKVFATAFSCGSVLACSGTVGHRLIGEYAEHLCHLGRAGFFAETDTQLERYSESVKRHFDFVRDIYKRYANIPNLEEVLKDDAFFISGQEIIDYKLADKFYC